MSDLSPSTVEELLAIKGLLEQARRMAEPGSSYHIAAAVILLDAANERALNAVANAVGKDGGREKHTVRGPTSRPVRRVVVHATKTPQPRGAQRR